MALERGRIAGGERHVVAQAHLVGELVEQPCHATPGVRLVEVGACQVAEARAADRCCQVVHAEGVGRRVIGVVRHGRVDARKGRAVAHEQHRIEHGGDIHRRGRALVACHVAEAVLGHGNVPARVQVGGRGGRERGRAHQARAAQGSQRAASGRDVRRGEARTRVLCESEGNGGRAARLERGGRTGDGQHRGLRVHGARRAAARTTTTTGWRRRGRIAALACGHAGRQLAHSLLLHHRREGSAREAIGGRLEIARGHRARRIAGRCSHLAQHGHRGGGADRIVGSIHHLADVVQAGGIQPQAIVARGIRHDGVQEGGVRQVGDAAACPRRACQGIRQGRNQRARCRAGLARMRRGHARLPRLGLGRIQGGRADANHVHQCHCHLLVTQRHGLLGSAGTAAGQHGQRVVGQQVDAGRQAQHLGEQGHGLLHRRGGTALVHQRLHEGRDGVHHRAARRCGEHSLESLVGEQVRAAGGHQRSLYAGRQREAACAIGGGGPLARIEPVVAIGVRKHGGALEVAIGHMALDAGGGEPASQCLYAADARGHAGIRGADALQQGVHGRRHAFPGEQRALVLAGQRGVEGVGRFGAVVQRVVDAHIGVDQEIHQFGPGGEALLQRQLRHGQPPFGREHHPQAVERQLLHRGPDAPAGRHLPHGRLERRRHPAVVTVGGHHRLELGEQTGRCSVASGEDEDLLQDVGCVWRRHGNALPGTEYEVGG